MKNELGIAGVTLARLRDAYPGIGEQLAANDRLRRTLGAVTNASPSLTRLLFSDTHALQTLGNLETPCQLDGADAESLVRWKQREFLRIAARDLTGIDPLEQVGANLAALGDEVLRSALRIAAPDEDLLIVGMGKLAGKELNYASDIDVMFVGQADDRKAREVMDIARQCFRIDAALRPDGRSGALVRTLRSFEAYWDQWAQPWEFQALLKSRPVVGPQASFDEWSSAAESALWGRSFGADDLRYLRTMKARSESIIADKGLTDREVKRGRGGIRDVEFAVQLLQLVHGGHDTSIRSSNTITALGQLADGGYITAEDATSLTESYRFLRTVEHRLQLVEQEQTHTIPRDRDSRAHLALVLGYRDVDTELALDAFEGELRKCQAHVRSAHERLYFRPLLETFAHSGGANRELVQERLSAFGFTDAERTRQAVAELTKGLARSSRLMQQLMPLLLSWLSEAPDPDEGLLGLRKLIAGFRTPSHVVGIFRDSPEAARRLCLLLGTSRSFSNGFAQAPEVLDILGDADELIGHGSPMERAQRMVEWKRTPAERATAIRRFTSVEKLRISAADVLELLPDSAGGGAARSELAETVLRLCVDEIDHSLPVAVIAMGRFGGRELAYSSDLDVIVLHGGSGPDDQLAGDAFAQALLTTIGGNVPAHRLYSLDYDLRPEGRKGALARSIEGVRQYYDEWASVWERQALVRARVVAGDADLGERFLETVRSFVWERPVDVAMLREVRHLKARMERERIPKGKDPRFNLKLGPGSLSDVEWTAQLLQLQHGIEEPNTLMALAKLEAHELINAEDRTVLESAWRISDRYRNRWHLINNGESDALPISGDKASHLARSFGTTPLDMREQYLAITRRARLATERLFYGSDE